MSQLKQDAYQAGKERDWGRAISVYEQILEIEKKNPTLVNELGDICLKAGETSRAVKHFLSAASLYRTTGLINNAVAIYKKILRHDEGNMNAHWYLAESRAGQGLKSEGRSHALAFLFGSGEMAGDIKEMFAKRCVTLLDLYHDDEEILDKLVQIFRMWEMPLEAARAQVLHCCLRHQQDDPEAAAEIEAIVAKESSIVNYPEFARWNKLVNPQETQDTGAFVDFGAVDLDDSGPQAPATDPLSTAPDSGGTSPDEPDLNIAPVASSSADGDSETSFAGLDAPEPQAAGADETSFGDLNAELAAPAGVDSGQEVDIDPLALEKDEEGCISIDTEDAGDLDGLLAAAIDETETATGKGDQPDQGENAEIPAPSGTADNSVNLLEQILADDNDDLLGTGSEQLETITAEIGAQVGGDADTADRQYEMGLVYLEMGMADQAIESFKSATTDPEYAARAYEMWSMTLERAHRMDEALAVLKEGAEAPTVDESSRLGLLYQRGKVLEQSGQGEEAGACYDEILAKDPQYLDVAARKAKLPVAMT